VLIIALFLMTYFKNHHKLGIIQKTQTVLKLDNASPWKQVLKPFIKFGTQLGKSWLWFSSNFRVQIIYCKIL